MKAVNDVFQDIFLVVVIFSFPLMVTNLYSVSLKKEVDIECMFIVSGLCTTLTQLFITSWYGNEVTLNVSLLDIFFFFVVVTYS